MLIPLVFIYMLPLWPQNGVCVVKAQSNFWDIADRILSWCIAGCLQTESLIMLIDSSTQKLVKLFLTSNEAILSLMGLDASRKRRNPLVVDMFYQLGVYGEIMWLMFFYSWYTGVCIWDRIFGKGKPSILCFYINVYVQRLVISKVFLDFKLSVRCDYFIHVPFQSRNELFL